MAASIGVTVLLYAVPLLHVLAWPLVLLSTLAHELGHGVAAAIVGGRFEALRLWSDASGVATWSGPPGRLRLAVIAAGGLVGPAVAAAFLFVLAKRERRARASLVALGLGLIAVDLLVVRNLFGFAFVAVVAVLCLAVASLVPTLAQTAMVLAAVQLALSVFSRSDYLFMRVARTSGGTGPSDVAQMASALFLPYWFWGAVCGAISIAVLAVGTVHYVRGMGGTK